MNLISVWLSSSLTAVTRFWTRLATVSPVAAWILLLEAGRRHRPLEHPYWYSLQPDFVTVASQPEARRRRLSGPLVFDYPNLTLPLAYFNQKALRGHYFASLREPVQVGFVHKVGHGDFG